MINNNKNFVDYIQAAKHLESPTNFARAHIRILKALSESGAQFVCGLSGTVQIVYVKEGKYAMWYSVHRETIVSICESPSAKPYNMTFAEQTITLSALLALALKGSVVIEMVNGNMHFFDISMYKQTVFSVLFHIINDFTEGEVLLIRSDSNYVDDYYQELMPARAAKIVNMYNDDDEFLWYFVENVANIKKGTIMFKDSKGTLVFERLYPTIMALKLCVDYLVGEVTMARSFNIDNVDFTEVDTMIEGYRNAICEDDITHNGLCASCAANMYSHCMFEQKVDVAQNFKTVLLEVKYASEETNY